MAMQMYESSYPIITLSLGPEAALVNEKKRIPHIYIWAPGAPGL